MAKTKSDAVVEYWNRFYVSEDGMHCTLCGQSGVIHTEAVATPTGVQVGRKNFCICPNGQQLRDNAFSTKLHGFDEFTQALSIFRKYDNPPSPFHCEHDILHVMVENDQVTDEDKERLDELGFFERDGYFASFRYGSA